jgi:hypothetical protein
LKTQQAHSLGATRFRASKDSPRGIPPFLWLNLVCLDAPLVAVAWLWLFARSFGVPFQIGNSVALFLTAWLIYLADRLADAFTLKPRLPRSLRQQFCLGHREIWIATLALVAGFDAYVVWRTTAAQTFMVGAVVGLLAVIYLVVNHPLGLIWRSLPAKEMAIGILFAAGIVVALLPRPVLTPPFTIAVATFAALCSLNCISIAAWECDLDRAQGKVSIATLHPEIIVRVGQLCLVLAAGALLLAILCRSAAVCFVCISVSALLLGYLNAARSFKEGRFTNRPRSGSCRINRRYLGRDQRTALADLVLLTPVLALIWAAL